MARPEKSEQEKRSYEHKVNLNYFEEQKSIELAAGRSFAQMVRELLENAHKSQFVSRDNRKAAGQVRQITDLANQLYIERQRELAAQAEREKQSELNRIPSVRKIRERKREAENDLWRELNELLRALNAQLLGYADNDN